MANSPLYEIGGEQRQSSSFAVSPLWPLLALMFAGGWLAWPWAVVNAYALNSPTRQREIVWAIGGVIGSAVLALAVLTWAAGAASESEGIVRARYALIGLAVFKLACGYRIYLLQSRTLELYEFYGGRLRNALPVVVAGFLLRSFVAGLLPFGFLRMAYT